MKRLKPTDRHDSIRGWFAYELHGQMCDNPDIWVVAADLGYGFFDKIRRDFPDRFVNPGAAEQAAVGIGIGLAESGKIPFVYSITTFLLYRPFELIRNYINEQKIPVKLVGSGRDHDYVHDGPSHWSNDAPLLFKTGDLHQIPIFENVKNYWPDTKEEIPEVLRQLVFNKQPSFVSLRR